MTYAPAKIKEVRVYVKSKANGELDDNEVGIVGGPSHVATGTSYHLGKDQLKMSKNPYSWRTARDKRGSNAASAIDLDDDWDDLRRFSIWLVEQCRANAPDTRDIREIIYSPDGKTVYRWDRERSVSSAPKAGDGDRSHLTHSHISWYRDSENNDKVGVFKRYYNEADGGNDMELTKNIQTALAAAGFDPGPVDGEWGPRTQGAFVAALQAKGVKGEPGPAGPPGAPGKTPTRVRISQEADVIEYIEA